MEAFLEKVYAPLEGVQVGAHFWCVGQHAANWKSEVLEMVRDAQGRRYKAADPYVAIIGCGRLGQHYAEAYSTYSDTEIVTIAEYNTERREAVGRRFGVEALSPDVHSLLEDIVPDIAAVVTPTRFYKEAVIACAEAGVKGVSSDKPIAAVRSDADEMVEACESKGVVYAGGNLQRAMSEVQEAAHMVRAGKFGKIIGSSVHHWSGEISGGGCQWISVPRLLAGAEVEEIVAWGTP